MAIRQPDSELFTYLDYFGDSQAILVPIHENRMGEEGYERMLREARHFADTYDKILVGVLEAYCTYGDHPILGKIPVLPLGQAGSGTVPRPLTVYDSREEAWRAVAQGLTELLEPYRPFFEQGISGSVFFDKEKNAWCFDKGRREGVSVWHREVAVEMEDGPLGIRIQKVCPTYTILSGSTSRVFNTGSDRVFQASIKTKARREINVLIQDHADNGALVGELQNSRELRQHGLHFTNEIPWLNYVLHLTQTHAYLTRAFENPDDEGEALYFNPYRPLSKPLELSAGTWRIMELLKQLANWEFLKGLEAPFIEEFSEEELEITVFQLEGGEWKSAPKPEDVFQIDMLSGERRGVDDYSNTIRIQLTNHSGQDLFISPIFLSNYVGSSMPFSGGELQELKAGEKAYLFDGAQSNINLPVRIEHRILAYNLPHEYLEVKILASPKPFSTFGYLMKEIPGPPGSEYYEEGGYFLEKAADTGTIRPLEGAFVASLLRIKLDNPAYNVPSSVRLEALLRRPDAEPFLRALFFESSHLAPRYELKQEIELQQEESQFSQTVQSATQSYFHTPDGISILEYQMQQLRPQLQGKAEKPILIALGDSWFNQAQPVDIPHFLMEDFIVLHAPLEGWEQLEEAVRRLEKMIAGVSSITLLLSPMGERLFDEPTRFLVEKPAEEVEDIRKILTDQYVTVLGELKNSWENGFKFLGSLGSRLQVVVHGYDYFPEERFGERFSAFSPAWTRSVAAFMVDALNARLQAAIEEMGAGNIHYLDLRRSLAPNDWASDVIPNRAGFRKLAGQTSLFISRRYSFDEELYPGSEYFLWQVARIEETEAAYQGLIDAYPEGEHRAWAEERLKAMQSADFPEVQAQYQSQTIEADAFEPASEALQSLRRKANDLISTNNLKGLFTLLDEELRRGAKPRERLSIFQKEFEQLEKQERRYKVPPKQMDQDMASLADAVGELVEGLTADDLREVGSGKSEVGSQRPESESPSRPLTPSPKTGAFTDPRDGRTYRTVELNGLVWMAENLNYDAGEGCSYYDNDPANGETYGRLYTWEAAQRACPPGWRLPTDEEWNLLRRTAGGPQEGFNVLQNDGPGEFAFSLAGMASANGRFLNIDGNGYYWTGTEENEKEAWSYKFRIGSGRINRALGEKSQGFSCRCVRNIRLSKMK